MTRDEIEARVRACLEQVCRKDVSSLTPEDDLVEKLGLDSLRGLEVLAIVEKKFGVRFPDEQLAGLRTIGRLVAAIEAGTGRKEP